MGEWLHLLFRKPSTFPSLDPRPGADIRYAVFALAVTSEVLAWRTGVFAGKVDLENAEDAEGFVAETVDGV